MLFWCPSFLSSFLTYFLSSLFHSCPTSFLPFVSFLTSSTFYAATFASLIFLFLISFLYLYYSVASFTHLFWSYSPLFYPLLIKYLYMHFVFPHIAASFSCPCNLHFRPISISSFIFYDINSFLPSHCFFSLLPPHSIKISSDPCKIVFHSFLHLFYFF